MKTNKVIKITMNGFSSKIVDKNKIIFFFARGGVILCMRSHNALNSNTVPYQYVGELEIVSPVRSDLALAADVPDVEFHAVRLHGFYVESLRRRDVRHIFRGQFFHQGRFARVVQAQQQDPQLLVRRRPQPFKHRQQSLRPNVRVRVNNKRKSLCILRRSDATVP